MARPKSGVETKRLEVKVPLVIYEAMIKHQSHREAMGIATTLNGIIVHALRMNLEGYLNKDDTP